MSLKPISKPFTPRLKRQDVPSVPVHHAEERPQPKPEQVEVVKQSETVDSLNSNQFQPRVLTFEEVCRYLNLKPEVRKFFTNKRGEYVRNLVEEYTWTVDEERRVHKIPKWFIEGGLQ